MVCMIVARDSGYQTTCGLTVPLDVGSCCADDGSLHRHVFFEFYMHVLHQQSWLLNSSWRLACGLTNVPLEDTSHYLLTTDCGDYMYFKVFHLSYLCYLVQYHDQTRHIS